MKGRWIYRIASALLILFLLLSALLSCDSAPSGDAEPSDTAESSTEEGISSADGTTEGALQTAYEIKGAYTVLSEVSFPVLTRLGTDPVKEKTLRVAVVDRESHGCTTYMDVLDADGTLVCSRIFTGYTMIFVNVGNAEKNQPARICGFHWIFDREGEGASLQMMLREYDLTDYLYKNDGTVGFAGEIDFRVYDYHSNTSKTVQYLPKMLDLKVVLRAAAADFSSALYHGGFLLAADTMTQEAYVSVPARTEEEVGRLTALLTPELADRLYADYVRRTENDEQ